MNNKNTTPYKLIESTYTTRQARRIKTKLEKLMASLHQVKDNRETISEIFTTNEKQLLLEDFKKRNIDPNKNEAQDTIMEIIKKIDQTPKTTIEMAFLPSDKFLKEIADNINSIYGNSLIESKCNPAIGGGVIIYHRGHRLDYSINKKLDEINI